MHTRIRDLISLRDDSWRAPGSVADNFRELAEIAEHDPKLLQGAPLGAIMRLLISVESRPGGPYYSEFPSERIVQRIDKETNTAIARFLAVYDIRLPNLDACLGETPEIKTFESASGARILDKEERALFARVRRALVRRLSGMSPDFRKKATAAVERTIAGNPDRQMTLMPLYVRRALGKRAENISDELLAEMGLANVFFWTAFIIYDDFWDEDEAAEPELLPVANLFARSYIAFFETLGRDIPGFTNFFHRLMDELDGANAWETRTCRMRREDGRLFAPAALPTYGDYAPKFRAASGHVLAPLALLLMTGGSLRAAETQKLIAYFKHYLIAMQLNDDMHDWEEDVRRGHISTVVDMLLRDADIDGPIDLSRDLENLRQTFWFTTLPKAARKAVNHARRSRAALHAIRGIDTAPLDYFIDYNQEVAERAIKEHKESMQFLNAFGTRHAG